MNTYAVSLTPKALQDRLDELEASRASRKRAWKNLQEIRWVLKDAAGVELPPAARKTIDLEGRIVKDGVRKTLTDRQLTLDDLVKAIREFRKYTDQPLTLRGSDYPHAVQELNKAIDRADGVLRLGLDVPSRLKNPASRAVSLLEGFAWFSNHGFTGTPIRVAIWRGVSPVFLAYLQKASMTFAAVIRNGSKQS